MSRFSALLEQATRGPWFLEPGQKRMAHRKMLPVDRIKSRNDLSFVGEAHPIGPNGSERQCSHANAVLFAASHEMAGLLAEALAVYQVEFENDQEISGGDFLEWFANWRQRVKSLSQRLR
jgi:hypothetical protein